MRLDPHRPAAETIQEAARVIRSGGIVLHPTDTLYGLACDPFNARALEKIYRLKKRPPERGFLLLISDPDWVSRLAAPIPHLFPALAREFWPGPVTFLLSARPELPALLTGEGGKVGVRWPALAYLQDWLKALGGPIVSTSANRSGHPVPASVAELKRLFAGKVDLFLEVGEMENQTPSSVVDLTVSPARLVRQGKQAHRLSTFLQSFQS